MQLLGKPWTEAHHWVDQYFRTLGPSHRGKLHHEEGIRYAKSRFGAEFAKAVRLHIEQDCGWVPKRADYQTGVVDAFGQRTGKKTWPCRACRAAGCTFFGCFYDYCEHH